VTPPSVSRRHSLTTQAFWLLAAQTAGYFFSMVFPLVVVRLFSQAEYGTYKQAYLAVGHGQMILGMGFALSAFYFFPREPERSGAVAFNILIFYLAVGLLALMTLTLWPGILVKLFANERLRAYAPQIGGVILFRLFSGFLEYVATAREDVKFSTIFIVCAQFTKSAVMLTAVWCSGKLAALLYGSMIQGILQASALIWYLQRVFPGFWKRVDWGLFRRQLSYGLPLGGAAMVFIVRAESHSYFVAHYVDAAAFAVYAVGCASIPLVEMVRSSVGTVLIPHVSRLHHAGEYREILLVTLRAIRKLSTFYWPLYVFLLVMSREFITFLYTRRYEGSVRIFAINLTLLPLTMLVLDPVLRAFAEYRFFLIRLQLILFAGVAAALLVVLPVYGTVGAITVVVMGALIEMSVTASKVAGALRMSWRDMKLASGIFKLGLSAVAAGLAAAVVRSFVKNYHPAIALAVCGAVFAPVYLLGAYFSEPDTREDLQNLVARGKRLLRMAA
jgi:O-antigen/teichoic acid export membrane protein